MTEPSNKKAADERPEKQAAGEWTSHVVPLHVARPALPTTHADEAAGFRKILQRRDFRLLWLAQVASQLADKFYAFTLLLVTYDISKSASFESLVMIAYTFPSVILSAPAGVYADRHDKRVLMVATNLIRCGLLILVPVSQFVPGIEGQAWPFILITFVFSSVGQVFAPSEAASIPSLVGKGQIMSATSLFMTTVILTLVLGTAAAPIFKALFGNFVPFYIGAGLFGLAALFVFGIGSSLKAVKSGAVPETHVLKEFREGLDILRKSAPLRLGLMQLTTALVVVFTVFALGPAYLAKELLPNVPPSQADSDTYIVLIPATIGLVGMAAALGQRQIKSKAALMVRAMIAAGACLVVIGIAPIILRHLHLTQWLIALVVVVALVFGVALGAILIPAFTVLQEKTTEETRGRIFGSIFSVINAAIAVPLLVAGVAADLLHSVGGVLAALGVLLLGLAVAFRTVLWDRIGVLDRS